MTVLPDGRSHLQLRHGTSAGLCGERPSSHSKWLSSTEKKSRG